MAGATVEIGPVDPSEPFRPFDDGAITPLVWGAQGSPMVSFRVRVTGVDAPACVGMTVEVDLGEGGLDPVSDRLALHCGASVAAYTIVERTDELCSSNGPLDTRLHVDLAGLGEASAHLLVPPGCPR